MVEFEDQIKAELASPDEVLRTMAQVTASGLALSRKRGLSADEIQAHLETGNKRGRGKK
jgi:hypothetical protein